MKKKNVKSRILPILLVVALIAAFITGCSDIDPWTEDAYFENLYVWNSTAWVEVTGVGGGGGGGLWEVDGTETQLITADELDIQNKSILNVLDIDGRDISADGAKLDAIEAGADVTDAANVNTAGAVMESDFNATTFLYATADNTPQPKTPVEILAILGLNLVENATHSTDAHTMTIDGRDVSADGTKLDGIDIGATKYPDTGEQAFLDADHTKLDAIEALADVTDAANVATAGALMDSGTDIITNLHIDWGAGAGQVDADDVPDSATKFWAGESGADVTDATNVASAGALMVANLENPPTEDEATKAPTSEWAFDHDADGTAHQSNVITITLIIDGGGSAITTGEKGHIEIPFACTITGWTLLGDQSGSIVIDVWNDIYANFPPTLADTIAGSEKPTLSSVQKNQDLALGTWTIAVSAGDILAFNVDSVATVERVTLSIMATKT